MSYLEFGYRIFAMAVFLYLVFLTGVWYKMTDHYTPLGWACEHFEWHWELL